MLSEDRITLEETNDQIILYASIVSSGGLIMRQEETQESVNNWMNSIVHLNKLIVRQWEIAEKIIKEEQ